MNITELETFFGKLPNEKRFNRVSENNHFQEEMNVVLKMKKGKEYYKHIINNIDLSSDNPKNSYIMWIYDKVKSVDENAPTIFVEAKASLPDIDVDFPPDQRENVIIYLKEKYGEDRVCQMLTFGRLQGRSALKEVLRVNESCSFDQMNDITNKIPQEAAISDKLEEMDEPSVIRWALENDPDTLREYCWEEDGELHGDFARDFAQALRIEGTFKTQGKHAAGVVVSSIDLNNLCPMVKETRGNEKIAGMEMGDLEAIGAVKFDILGVNLLKKIHETCGVI
tara:strand:- start:844 stop:1686 length:843 start_codon:yes stop_codon:yes gene_type:complete